MIFLNEVLYGLTHIGPERFPLSGPRMMDVLSRFGLKQDEHRKTALEMLQLAGHIDYVIDRKGRGLFSLARPHLRPRPDGRFILAGARSPDMLQYLSAKCDSGTSWNIGGVVIKQPDVAILSLNDLDGIDEEIITLLGVNSPPELTNKWDLPSGDLPSWEATVLDRRQHLTNHPSLQYRDERSRIFNPDDLKWPPLSNQQYVFDHTGPLFLIRRPTTTYKEHVLLIKDRKGNFNQCILPPGLDHQRWARLMLLASYGKETIKGMGGEILRTRREAQLPTGLSRALVDITGRLPRHEGAFMHFLGVGKDIAQRVIQASTETFVATMIYHETKGGMA